MDLIIQPKLFRSIPEVIQNDFMEELVVNYQKLCTYNTVFYSKQGNQLVPSEQTLLDFMEPYLWKTASYYEYSDSVHYQNIMTDEGQEEFLILANEEYLPNFLIDFSTAIQLTKLCLFNEENKKHINFPLTEVW